MSLNLMKRCVIAFALCMCISSAPAANRPTTAPAAQVSIDKFNFSPETLTVAAGTKVTWINHDDIPHTATSSVKPRLFNSGALDTDQQFTFEFSTPGVYEYFCAIHPHMTGKIIVK